MDTAPSGRPLQWTAIILSVIAIVLAAAALVQSRGSDSLAGGTVHGLIEAQGLAILDQSMQPVVTIGANARNEATIEVIGPDRGTVATLGADRQGGYLVLTDPALNPGIEMGSRRDENGQAAGFMQIKNQDDDVLLDLGADEFGLAELTVVNRDGVPVGELRVGPHGEGRLLLFDAGFETTFAIGQNRSQEVTARMRAEDGSLGSLVPVPKPPASDEDAAAPASPE